MKLIQVVFVQNEIGPTVIGPSEIEPSGFCPKLYSDDHSCPKNKLVSVTFCSPWFMTVE